MCEKLEDPQTETFCLPDMVTDLEIRELLPYINSLSDVDRSLSLLYLLMRAPTSLLSAPTENKCRALTVAVKSFSTTGRSDGLVKATSSQLQHWADQMRQCLTVESRRREGMLSYRLKGDPLSSEGAIEIEMSDEASTGRAKRRLFDRFPGFAELLIQEPVAAQILARILDNDTTTSDPEPMDLTMLPPDDVELLVSLGWLHRAIPDDDSRGGQHFLNQEVVMAVLKQARIASRGLRLVTR